jgi:NADH dehydrogenase
MSKTKKKRILVLGGGFTGMYALKELRKRFGYNSSYEIALINENNYFLFTPLLHEVATGGISVNNAIEPLRKVARKFFDKFYLGKVESVDLEKQVVKTSTSSITYDYLVLALGSTSFFYNVKGAEKYSYTLKSLDDALELKDHFLCAFEKASMTEDKAEKKKLLHFVVVGGGPTGVELASEMQELFTKTFSKYFSEDLVKLAKVCLVQNGKVLLPQFSDYFQHKSYQALVEKHKIKVILSDGVKQVGKDFVELASGKILETYTPIWTAGVAPVEVNFKQSVEKDRKGRIVVNQFSQIEGYGNVFVGGDMAAYTDPDDGVLPATAQVASRQGPSIARNMHRLENGKELAVFDFTEVGKMVSLGRWKALAQVKKMKFAGHFAWWLWRTIYLIKLISFPKKLKVVIDWTIGIFSTRDISKC